eukprot:PRCOL_00005426-RA
MAECEKHSTPDDCWLVIDGAAYDVTSFIDKHPGGAMIYVRAGRDCTQIFDSYHQDRVRAMLPKFKVADVSDYAPGKSNSADVLVYGDEGGFYRELKKRVAAKFRATGKNPRYHPEMLIKSFVILAGVAASYYGTYWAMPGRFAASLACAVLLGFFRAEVGMSIQHDANHGSYTTSNNLGYVMGLTLDMVGASSWVWKQVHVNGHHAYTNVPSHDTDVWVDRDGDVRRIVEGTPHYWYYKFQAFYLPFLYGALSLKSIIGDLTLIRTQLFGDTHRFVAPTKKEAVLFWALKAASLAYLVALPLACSPHGTLGAFALFMTEEWTCGLTLAYMFQVAHVSTAAVFPEAKDGKVAMGWATAQCATTINFAPGNWFWTHVSGGLNHQVEHHLFPGICHMHYPMLAPIVRETCEEFGVPYLSYPTFWGAFMSHWEHMHKVGQPIKVPTLGDA